MLQNQKTWWGRWKKLAGKNKLLISFFLEGTKKGVPKSAHLEKLIFY